MPFLWKIQFAYRNENIILYRPTGSFTTSFLLQIYYKYADLRN